MLMPPGLKTTAVEVSEDSEEEQEEAGEDASSPTDAGEEAEAEESAEADDVKDEPSTQEGGRRVVRPTIMGTLVARSPEDPLVRAVFERNAPAAKNLIALGADVNVLDKQTDTTALMQAVTNGDAGLVSALIGAGADVNIDRK